MTKSKNWKSMTETELKIEIFHFNFEPCVKFITTNTFLSGLWVKSLSPISLPPPTSSVQPRVCFRSIRVRGSARFGTKLYYVFPWSERFFLRLFKFKLDSENCRRDPSVSERDGPLIIIFYFQVPGRTVER